MGYTHYWNFKKENENEAFDKFSKVCSKLHKNLPAHIKICDGLGEGKPLFSNVAVNFNGDGSQNLEHETFHVEISDTDFNFCKTARKPYDLLVGACLLAAHFILNCEISSDGKIEEWKPIADYFNETVNGEYIVTDELLTKLFDR